jgi:hypothetical protein
MDDRTIDGMDGVMFALIFVSFSALLTLIIAEALE